MIVKEREERVVATQSACMVRIDTYHRSHSKKNRMCLKLMCPKLGVITLLMQVAGIGVRTDNTARVQLQNAGDWLISAHVHWHSMQGY